MCTDLSDNDQFYYEFRLVYQNPTGIVGGEAEFSKKYSCKISKLIQTSSDVGSAPIVVGPPSDDIETQEVEVSTTIFRSRVSASDYIRGLTDRVMLTTVQNVVDNFKMLVTKLFFLLPIY